ncbi:chorismate--pyruvate lyase family protein [Parahaliea mediterranea]|uniref:chorismate--pyruvate lyase family protein n=1 Tax=Parahaliea mediterranea TaxID=651086 RepID=UPI0013005B9B|nr:chorismate lyase [Parahaliea mediterranea]
MPGCLLPPQAEPQWRPAGRIPNYRLGHRERAWLLDDGSLTRRIIANNPGQFRVQRLRQEWVTPLPSERRLLGLPLRQRALVREVILQVDDVPLVFARSLIPVSSLTGELRHLRQLRNRPLGAILFRMPGMQRSPFEVARIGGNSSYLPSFLRQTDSTWGRRSCFDLQGRQLMVSEVFLQAFSPWQAEMPVHRSQHGKVNAAILRSKQ